MKVNENERFRVTHMFFKKDLEFYFNCCDSLEEASRLHRNFIEINCLGASDMTEQSGMVYDREKERYVAYISYNGRIWTSDDENFIRLYKLWFKKDYVKE